MTNCSQRQEDRNEVLPACDVTTLVEQAEDLGKRRRAPRPRPQRQRHFAVAPAGAALRSGGGLARPGHERPDTECIMNTLSRKPLIDQVIEAYVDWREACLRVNDGYLSWASLARPGEIPVVHPKTRLTPIDVCLNHLVDQRFSAQRVHDAFRVGPLVAGAGK